MKRTALVLVALVWTVATQARAEAMPSPGGALRDNVARRFAPVFFQEVRDDRDLYAAFDFDGNWAGQDNAQNLVCITSPEQCATSSPCQSGSCALVATVYYTVIETSTHWFVQYMPYHPVDAKSANGHEHDTESVFVVVAKDGGNGKLLALETRFHTDWFVYVDAVVGGAAKAPNGSIHVDEAGHPLVYSQQVGHGLCGGFSPPFDALPDLQVTCEHEQTPHIEKTGVVYRPDRPAEAPAVADGQSVETGYALVEILDTFWARRAEVGWDKPFLSVVSFTGERCDVLACPKEFGGPFMGDEGDAPSGPWNQEGGVGVSGNGSQFFDPAYTMSRRLTFPTPYALDYCHNPYVGVLDGCGATSATPPASGDSESFPNGDESGSQDEGNGRQRAARRASTSCGAAPMDPSSGIWAIVGGVGAVLLRLRRAARKGE